MTWVSFEEILARVPYPASFSDTRALDTAPHEFWRISPCGTLSKPRAGLHLMLLFFDASWLQTRRLKPRLGELPEQVICLKINWARICQVLKPDYYCGGYN